MKADSNTIYILLTFAGLIGVAIASYVVARKQNQRDYSHDLADIVQALEVSNKTLREELIRVTAHRDQLLAEQAALLKKFLINGNGSGHAKGDG